jgi:hypothetical protein
MGSQAHHIYPYGSSVISFHLVTSSVGRKIPASPRVLEREAEQCPKPISGADLKSMLPMLNLKVNTQSQEIFTAPVGARVAFHPRSYGVGFSRSRPFL